MNKKIKISIGILALLIVALTVLFFIKQQTPTGKAVYSLDTIELATTPQPWSAFIYIADNKGFFKEQGLNVNFHNFQTGKLALDAMLGGSADITTVADFPITLAGIAKQNISVIATIASDVADYIIARKDSGISKPEDLVGKKIATPKGGGPMFTTQLFLKKYNISLSEVNVLYLNPSDLVPVLVRHDIDAFVCFPPFYYIAEEALPNNTILFDPTNIYTETWNIVTRANFYDNNINQRKLKKFFAALEMAETFYKENKGESVQIVINYTGISEKTARKIMEPIDFRIRLDRELISRFYQEAQWAIDNQLTSDKGIPDYYRLVDAQYVAEIDSSRVTI